MQTKTFFKKPKSLFVLLAASSVLALAGCAGHPPTAQTLQPTQLLWFSNASYIRLLRDSPDTSLAFLAILSQRMHQRMNEIEILSLKNATHRVIRYILSQALGSCSRCNTPSFELPITKRLVANHLSIQPETFSRIIHHLSDEGIIQIEGRLICILDTKRLENYE